MTAEKITVKTGTRADYQADVKEAEKAYAENGSSRNLEDMIAARNAMTRHYPDAKKPDA